eukprot:12727643-Prorocentrum_lima.AAC.1
MLTVVGGAVIDSERANDSDAGCAPPRLLDTGHINPGSGERFGQKECAPICVRAAACQGSDVERDEHQRLRGI